MFRAVQEVEAGASIYSAAKKYHLYATTLQKRVLAHRGRITLTKRGHKIRMPEETEQKLAVSVRQMGKFGFQPTIGKLREMAYDYLRADKLTHLFNDKLPGYDWAKSFMNRHHLCLEKKGSSLITAHGERLLHSSDERTFSSQTPPEVLSPATLIRMLQQFAPRGMKYVVQLVPDIVENPFKEATKSCDPPSAQPQKRRRSSCEKAKEVKKKGEENGKSKRKKRSVLEEFAGEVEVDDPAPLKTEIDSDGLSEIGAESPVNLEKTITKIIKSEEPAENRVKPCHVILTKLK